MISHRELFGEDELPDFEEQVSQLRLIDSEPWDVLIVLDACRWDAYRHIYGETIPVTVPGNGSTPAWVDAVWTRDTDMWDDVTYISANPQVEGVGDYSYEDSLHITDCVGEYVPLHDDWHDYVKSVHPEQVTDDAIGRDPPLVLHLIQPHTPFIGSFSFSITAESKHYDVVPDAEECEPFSRPQRLVEKGLVDRSVLQTAYLSNLQLTHRYVRRLRKHFTNRGYNVVTTADHGEAFGPEHWDHGGESNQNRVVPWDATWNRNS